VKLKCLGLKQKLPMPMRSQTLANGQCPISSPRRIAQSASPPALLSPRAPALSHHPAHSAKEQLEKHQSENNGRIKSTVRIQQPVFTWKGLAETYQGELSPLPPLSGQRLPDKYQCDCKCLIENVKDQFEKRFSSLETLVMTRLSILESNMQERANTFEHELSSSGAHLEALNSRVLNLETSTCITSKTLEDTQSCALTLRAQIDSAAQLVEETYSQITSLLSGLQKDSQASADIQTGTPDHGCAFIPVGMHPKNTELAHPCSSKGSRIDDAEEKHKRHHAFAADLTRQIQFGLVELAKGLDLDKESFEREEPERVPTVEETRQVIKVPRHMQPHDGHYEAEG